MEKLEMVKFLNKHWMDCHDILQRTPPELKLNDFNDPYSLH